VALGRYAISGFPVDGVLAWVAEVSVISTGGECECEQANQC
jgi:hypothetical protein